MKFNVKNLYSTFVKYIQTCSSEQDLREMFSQRVLSGFGFTDEMVSHVKHEYSVLHGRIDSLYGHAILEFKAPGTVPKNRSSKKFLKYVEQVSTHISGIAKEHNSETDNLIGILFDGSMVSYIYLIDRKTIIKGPYNFDYYQFRKLLNSLYYGLTAPKAISSRNLIADFGLNSVLCNELINLLYHQTIITKNDRSALLFSQWKVYFREICGYEFESKKNLRRIVEVNYGINNPDIETLTFAIHTYFSIILTFLAVKVGEVISKSFDADHWLAMSAEQDTDALHDNLNIIFQNIPFKEIGYTNLIEPTFFSWFIQEKEVKIFEKIRLIAKLVAEYSTATLKIHDIHESDILKELYQSLSPRELRHSLGEFYTPDWLAEHTLLRLKYSPKPGIKTIDPTCGSGTFIIAAINAYKSANCSLEPDQLSKNILADIKGIDLNPLAVAASKINYLIALGEENLIALEGSDIEIPIYLSDSMLAPLEHKYETGDEYVIPTKVANFSIKKSFVNDQRFIESMAALEDAIKNGDDYKLFHHRLMATLKWTSQEIDDALEDTYSILQELENKGLNGIWAGIIKNFFAPTFMGLSDYIIGNPPWVNWENLPESYRDSIKKYWSEYAYNLFRIKGMQARLGSAHDDICVLLTYIVADNFLKFNGKIGFILPQTLFKSKGGGDGFRRFEIENNFYFDVISVDDMVSLQPFDAANKTSVFIATKSKTPTKYPVKYYKWIKNKGYTTNPRHTLEIILENVDIKEQIAIPIDENKPSSPWLSGDQSVVNKLHKIVGKSHYQARKGVDTSLNQVFWVKAIQEKGALVKVHNCQSRGRSTVRQRNDIWVEKGCLYPVLRGQNFKKWNYEIDLDQILLYDVNTGKPLDKSAAKKKFPKAVKYFSTSDYIPLLEKRAIYQKHLSQYPNYSCFDIGPYSFSEFKVVWKALASGMQSCVISRHEKRIIIPDHNVMMIPLDNEKEAFYLAGILNSRLASLFVTSYVEWFFSTHILEYFLIPKFNNKIKLHNLIGDLSIKAHNETDLTKLEIIEKKLDKSVDALFDYL